MKLRRVKIKQYDTDKDSKYVWFHMFGTFSNEDGSEVLAVVELEDGKVETVFCEKIQFVERPNS